MNLLNTLNEFPINLKLSVFKDYFLLGENNILGEYNWIALLCLHGCMHESMRVCMSVKCGLRQYSRAARGSGVLLECVPVYLSLPTRHRKTTAPTSAGNGPRRRADGGRLASSAETRRKENQDDPNT